MEPWYEDDTATIYHGDSLAVLRSLPDCSVQCCVTSPPYWALRDYQTAKWIGGDESCDHLPARLHDDRQEDREAFGDSYATHKSQLVAAGKRFRCEKCGATKEDKQLGLEATPEEYVAHLVELFREVRRVLRDDGTLWLNIGDTYSVGRGASQGYDPKDSKSGRQKFTCRPNDRALPGLKKKDLVGIPWMVAFALRADGWYLRAENIWAKRSPMPDSTKDRPTKSHEQVFLFTKSPRYFYDYVGSQEPAVSGSKGSSFDAGKTKARAENLRPVGKGPRAESTTRNMRSVWTLSAYPLKAAHFAAYPPELVRRCLSAGVTPKGCCPQCGKPWERIVEKRRVPTRSGKASKVNATILDTESPYQSHNGDICGNRGPKRHITETITTGWKPGCDCDAREPVPCVVLDPFHGAGTTWKVCQRLDLRYVGIDLNEEYLQLSVDRPPVTFPHERKQSKKRRVRNHVTPFLSGME